MGHADEDTMTPPPTTGLQLQSRICSSGTLELSLEAMAIDPPTPDEVVIRIEAAPVNPSDLGLLLGPADLSTIETRGEGASRRTTMRECQRRDFSAMAARFDKAMPVGNEGAGVIVAAGDQVKAFHGKTVAVLRGGLYCEYRTVPASSCLAFSERCGPRRSGCRYGSPRNSRARTARRGALADGYAQGLSSRRGRNSSALPNFARVASEIRSTFVSHYTQSIGLADLLRPDVLQAISRKGRPGRTFWWRQSEPDG